MPPNNTNSSKSTEPIEISLDLDERRTVFKKCFSKEETSLRCDKMQANGFGQSRSQTNVKEDGRQGWDGPERNKSVCSLVDELLCDIYSKMEVKRRISATTCDLSWQDSDQSRCCSNEVRSSNYLRTKDVDFLTAEKSRLEKLITDEGNKLVKYLKRKNFLLIKREAYYDVITAYIQAVSTKTREDTKMKFSLTPGAETGFSQWLDAMKMVAQLPGGMPAEFRTKLWLQLSEKHLNDQNVDWEKAEAVIFNEWTNPDDEELGVQIVKDLHRTGCSLFCGEQEHNQALLKRVLLAYARWNKNVGYCQGFNMLAALILQVMDKDEKNAVKVMIYLIEGVLPESYFANNLRGLSVDMAVFRDLLRLRLPKLSKHLEALQHDTNAGTSYEPPLTNVFTMQWFLTLFSNCLPQQTVLRVWDLVFLYGNEVLLRTALAIWGILQDRVITVESADEFYSIMGVVTREMLEFGLMDANTLVKMIAMVDPFPNELQELREKYLYNISPWTQSVQSAAKKGIRLFYSDPDDQDDTEDEDKIALATAYGVFRRRESTGRELQLSGPTLDIGVLKQQYAKLRQRQRQAHVIITAACSSNFPGNIASGPSVSVNHLLMGKSALVNKGRRIGPPAGSIPPPNYKTGDKKETKKPKIVISGETFDWKDAEKRNVLSSQNKSNKRENVIHENEKNRIKAEDEENKLKTNHDRMGIGVTEKSVEDSLRTKETGAGSSGSSTSTELCDDEFHRISDFDSEDNSDAMSYRLRGTSPRPIRSLPEPPDSSARLPGKVEFSDNGGCDKDNYKEIKNFATDLVKEIEDKIQTSEKLKKLRDDFGRGEQPENLPVEATEVKKFDNTTNVVSLLDSDIQFLNDNILKPEPEVPICENVIKPRGEEDSEPEDDFKQREDPKAEDYSKQREDLEAEDDFKQREDLKAEDDFKQREDPKAEDDFKQREDPKAEDDSKPEEDPKAKDDFKQREDPKAEKDFKQREDPKAEDDFKQRENPKAKDDFKQREDPKAEKDFKQRKNPKAEDDSKPEEDPKPEDDFKQREDPKAEDDLKSEMDPKPEEDSKPKNDWKPEEESLDKYGERVRRKSDLGLNVIRENLEILHKFSVKSSNKATSFEIESNPEMETSENKLSETLQSNVKDEGKKEKTSYSLVLEQEVQKSSKNETKEPLRSAQNFLVEKAISPITEKSSKAVKVNKEVNTEITFGVDEVEISTSKPKFRMEDEPKFARPERFREEESPIPATSRRSRESHFREREKDEIKQRLETSKSDWELKMKRIAELETTTRETLNEIQAASVHRKSLHRSLDRNTRRSYVEDNRKFDGELSPPDKSFLPKIKLDSSEEPSQPQKLKTSALSFDAITSRTEKLLGMVEFNRSTDDTYYKRNLSPEFENRKQKDSTSKFKKLIEESYGGDLDFKYEPTAFGSKSYEFYSSPTSPECRNRSSVKYSEYFSPKKYPVVDIEDPKGSRYDEEDFLKITQNGSKTSVDLVKRKYSPERKKPEDEFESHSSKSNFNPFPTRTQPRPKELGVKLGLYPTSPEGQSKKS